MLFVLKERFAFGYGHMDEIQTRIVVTGQVRLKRVDGPAVEVRRCMGVLSCDDHAVGMVAAVCFDQQQQEISAILLGRFPVTADYRIIPIDLIDKVSEDAVHLRITAEATQELAQLVAS